MPLTRQEKEKIVVDVQQSLRSAVAMVMISYNGLTVAQSGKLRDNLAQAGGQMRVVPKRLLKIILEKVGIGIDPTELEGQLALAWANDPVVPAKILNDLARKSEGRVKLLAGSLEGDLLTITEVESLASLPTRPQLLGQLLSVMVGPMREAVVVMASVSRSLTQVLAAIRDKKQAAETQQVS